MAPKTNTLTLKQSIEQELDNLEARAAELRIALKVVHEFAGDEIELPAASKSVILKPNDEVPEAVKSRIAETGSRAARVADTALELDRS